jgi:hypothetical protein
MKKIGFTVIICLLISSCSTTKDAGITRSEIRQTKKIAEQAAIKKAVESRRYVIRMEKIFLMGGGFIDLVPRNNYIIVDGGAASISLGYVGRSYGIRPISGINLNGQTIKYELKSNEEKGTFNINMEVKSRNDKFDLYLNIGSDGYCNVSVINSNIQTVSYFGQLIPISQSRPDTGDTGKTEQL